MLLEIIKYASQSFTNLIVTMIVIFTFGLSAALVLTGLSGLIQVRINNNTSNNKVDIPKKEE